MTDRCGLAALWLLGIPEMIPLDSDIAGTLASIIKEAYAIYELYQDRKNSTAAFRKYDLANPAVVWLWQSPGFYEDMGGLGFPTAQMIQFQPPLSSNSDEKRLRFVINAGAGQPGVSCRYMAKDRRLPALPCTCRIVPTYAIHV